MILKKALFVTGIFLIAAGIGVFLYAGSGDVEVKPATEHIVPDLVFKNYAGEDVKLSDFRGKNIIVNFWASWCPFCKRELKDFVSLQKEFGDKITILAVNRQEALEVSRKYSDELGVTNDLIFLLDLTDSFYPAIGGFSMPETIFVDKDGFIKYHKRGPMEFEEMKRRVEETFGL